MTSSCRETPVGEDAEDTQAGYLDYDSEEQAKKNEEQRAQDLAELLELMKRYGWEKELNRENWPSAAEWLVTHREELTEDGIPAGRIDYFYTMLEMMVLSPEPAEGS